MHDILKIVFDSNDAYFKIIKECMYPYMMFIFVTSLIRNNCTHTINLGARVNKYVNNNILRVPIILPSTEINDSYSQHNL